MQKRLKQCFLKLKVSLPEWNSFAVCMATSGNEYQIYQSFPPEWLGAWESINGNPDMYIFQGYDGNYSLLTYSYDKECQRGSFSCYDMDSDEEGWYMKC